MCDKFLDIANIIESFYFAIHIHLDSQIEMYPKEKLKREDISVSNLDLSQNEYNMTEQGLYR